MNMLIRMFRKQIFSLFVISRMKEKYTMQVWRACLLVLAEILMLLCTLNASMY